MVRPTLVEIEDWRIETNDLTRSTSGEAGGHPWISIAMDIDIHGCPPTSPEVKSVRSLVSTLQSSIFLRGHFGSRLAQNLARFLMPACTTRARQCPLRHLGTFYSSLGAATAALRFFSATTTPALRQHGAPLLLDFFTDHDFDQAIRDLH